MTKEDLETMTSPIPGSLTTGDQSTENAASIKRLIPHPTRIGWVCEPASGGGFIAWSASSTPSIIWNHVDGPLLTFRNGEMHWLTLWERVRCWFGYDNECSLERKYRPHLQAAAFFRDDAALSEPGTPVVDQPSNEEGVVHD